MLYGLAVWRSCSPSLVDKLEGIHQGEANLDHQANKTIKIFWSQSISNPYSDSTRRGFIMDS